MLDLYTELDPRLLAHSQSDTERRWRSAFGGASESPGAAAPSGPGSSRGLDDPWEQVERAQALRVEEVLVGLSKLLHSGGTPTWRFEFNMTAVARGLGLPNTRFGVFPAFVLVSFDRQRGQGHHHGGSTLFITTAPGMNMAKLDEADALARRIASYGTNTPSPFKRKLHTRKGSSQGAGAEANGEQPSDVSPEEQELRRASAAALRDVPRRLAALRQRYSRCEELGAAILELASTGPGFYLYSRHMPGAAASEEELWGPDLVTPDASQHGGASMASMPPSPSPTVWGGTGAMAAMGSASAMSSPPAPTSGTHSHGQHHVHGGRHSTHGDLQPPVLSRQEVHRQRCATFNVLAVNDALQRMHGIETAKPLYPAWTQALAMCVSSAGCAPTFFGGTIWDGVVAGLLGLAVGLMGMAASRSRGDRLLRAYEFLAAVVCSFLARLIDGLVRHTCMQPVVLSGLIWLVQGWTLTNATVEVATRNPMTGTSHLFIGIITTALMGFGLDVGNAAADIMSVPAPSLQDVGAPGSACRAPLPLWSRILMFVPLELAFALLLNARPAQLLPITGLAAVSFLASTGLDASTKLIKLDSFLAAALVSCLGNMYANLTGRPAMALTASAVFILVPGCMALRGVTAIFDGASSVGLALTGRVLNVAVSIGAGIFLANLCVVPKEVTHVTQKALKAGPAGAAMVKAWMSAATAHGYNRQVAMSPVNL
jgi:uncharacterized membrane protein YjjP (DUF1212 family)